MFINFSFPSFTGFRRGTSGAHLVALIDLEDLPRAIIRPAAGLRAGKRRLSGQAIPIGTLPRNARG